MHHSLKKLPKNLIEVSFSVKAAEYQPFLAAAAARIGQNTSIPGFRPGKASYEVIKTRFGELKILEEALTEIVPRFFAEVVRLEKINTLGQPSISVTKLAPGDTLEYKLTVTLIPEVKLCDWKKIKIEKGDTAVNETEIKQALGDLQKARVKEIVSKNPARKEDKIIVDMEMFKDGVSVEGGAVRGHSIYLSEPYYVPGFTEKLIGVKRGETRQFDLEFPKEHFQKSLAGERIVFKVTATEVFELVLPEFTDEFARGFGQKSADALKNIIISNLRTEKEKKESERQEIVLLEQIVGCSVFEDIPEILINSEINKMLAELEHGVASQGLEFNDYLKQIKKTLADLRLEFAAEAIKRVKVALVIRKISLDENITVSDAEIMSEVTRLLNLYKNDIEVQNKIKSLEYQEYIATSIRNKKVLDLLRNTCVK